MTLRASIKKTLQIGGKTLNETLNEDADGVIVHEISVPAANAAVLTTRTDADTGVATVDASGHAITDSDVVDLYWVGGSRRGMDVSSVSVNAVSIDGGDGDDLPTQDTVVAIVIPTEVDAAVLGTNVKAILLATAANGQFVFRTSGAESFFKRLGDGVAYDWHDGNGTVNPITGDSIEIVRISHDDVSLAKVMQVGILYDN